MMSKINAWMFGCMAVLGWLGLSAQTPSQIIVANGGVFGPSNIVTVSAWNLSNGSYTVFDSFPGTSVQHVFLWGNEAFVCADSTVMKYDITTYQRLAEARIYGVRQSAVYGNHLIVTKGYGTAPGTASVEVRNLSDLSLAYAVTGISGECEGVVVAGNAAYVANAGIFGASTGNMAVIDLLAQNLDHIVPMDTMGAVVQDLYSENGHVYAVSTHGFGSPFGYFSDYSIASDTFSHRRINYSLSTTAGIDMGLLYADLGGTVGTFDLGNGSPMPINNFNGGFAAMAIDTFSHQLFATKTDYFTFGKLFRYDLLGNVLDSVDVGISPEAIAVDYDLPIGVAPVVTAENRVFAYPQPFNDRLTVDLRNLSAPAQRLSLFDIAGRKMMEQSLSGNQVEELEMSNLVAGVYILQVQTRNGVSQMKVVKAQH